MMPEALPPPPPSPTDDLEFGIWLENGVKRGWVSPPFCALHGVMPITSDEYAEMEEGLDPCVFASRVWGPDE